MGEVAENPPPEDKCRDLKRQLLPRGGKCPGLSSPFPEVQGPRTSSSEYKRGLRASRETVGLAHIKSLLGVSRDIDKKAQGSLPPSS